MNITEEKFIEIMEDEEEKYPSKWNGDNAIQGLNIIAKYFDTSKEDIIQGADHDVIYSVGVSEIIEKGITEEDVIALRKLNWMVEDGDYLACFV